MLIGKTVFMVSLYRVERVLRLPAPLLHRLHVRRRQPHLGFAQARQTGDFRTLEVTLLGMLVRRAEERRVLDL